MPTRIIKAKTPPPTPESIYLAPSPAPLSNVPVFILDGMFKDIGAPHEDRTLTIHPFAPLSNLRFNK
jgi:hypothetical protein